MPVNHSSNTALSGNRSSQSSSEADNMDRSHKGDCPVDPTTQRPGCKHRDNLALGSGQPPPKNESTYRQEIEVETGKTDPSMQSRSPPHTEHHSELGHNDLVI